MDRHAVDARRRHVARRDAGATRRGDRAGGEGTRAVLAVYVVTGKRSHGVRRRARRGLEHLRRRTRNRYRPPVDALDWTRRLRAISGLGAKRRPNRVRTIDSDVVNLERQTLVDLGSRFY